MRSTSSGSTLATPQSRHSIMVEKEKESVPLLNMKAAGSGVMAGVVTDAVFYGIDSYKIQAQASGHKIKFHRLFRGLLGATITGSIPSYGVFFMLYQPMKETVDRLGENAGAKTSPAFNVMMASLGAAIPSSLVYVPCDVIRKRLVLGVGGAGVSAPTHVGYTSSSSFSGVAKEVFVSHGLSGFFIGWRANMVKDMVFSGLKMSIYEATARFYLRYVVKKESNDAKNLTPNEGAIVGCGAGVFTAFLTMPLDTVNTRIKSGELASFSIAQAHVQIVKKEGIFALFQGILPRTLTIGFGSSLFWFAYAKANAVLGTFSE